jgi:hypothetical protein
VTVAINLNRPTHKVGPDLGDNQVKTTAFISLGMVALAAGLVGCKELDNGQTQDVRSCTDRNGKVVDESYCLQQTQTANGNNPTEHLLLDMLVYRWVFGGNYGGGYVGSGSFYRQPGVVYYRSSSDVGRGIMSSGNAVRYTSVSRGGFGSSFSGGEGEGIGE